MPTRMVSASERLQERSTSTCDAIMDRWQDFAERQVGARLSLVRTSATLGEEPDFELDYKDFTHKLLKLRLRATKAAELVLVKANHGDDRNRLAEEIIARSQLLLNSMASGVVGIVINRVADARAVFEQLQIPEDRKVLLTGRVRGWERDRLLRNWLPRLRAGSREEADAPLGVVATQCIKWVPTSTSIISSPRSLRWTRCGSASDG